MKQFVKEDVIFKINDINYDLYCFWNSARDNLNLMVKTIKEIKKRYQKNGRDLFEKFKDNNCTTEFERGVRFFILNRITFSGTVDSGGYSQESFDKRFTQSSINRLALLSPILKNVQMTCEDYENLLFEEGEDVFIFFRSPIF